MRIGEVARLAGVRIDTVRFYERRKLLPEPARRPSGYRYYSMATVERVRFAKALQHLGFTLDEVGSVLADVDRGAATCVAERRRFETVLVRVDEKLAELRRIRRRLVGTLSRCGSGKCRLLESAAVRRSARAGSSTSRLTRAEGAPFCVARAV